MTLKNDFFKTAIQNKFLNRISSIEYIVSEKCQNNCSYCYRIKKHVASSVQMIDVSRVKLFTDNLREMFDLDDNFFHIRRTELFGGDGLLDYQKAYDILDYLLNDVKYEICVIPTNARMVQELSTYDLEKLLNVSEPGKVGLSLSVDGKPQDNQRPLSKYGRMMAYDSKINYKKLISIAKKYHCGFHPMLSFNSPETWFESFKFFAEQEVVPYLLEIRHPVTKEVSVECIKQLIFIRKYINTFDNDQMRKAANTIGMSIVPRGLGCSAHTTIPIMPNGDIPFCHRVIDPPQVMANVLTKEYDISKLITLTAGHDHRNHPLCAACAIKKACAGQCAGASYEYWGDPWIPIESICNYIKLKAFVMSYYFNDWKELRNHLTEGFTMDDLQKEVTDIFGQEVVESLLNL